MITIRRFTSHDQEPIRQLITRIMTDEFGEEQAAYPTDDIKDIGRAYGGLGEAFFVATRDGGELIGTVAVKKEDDRVALLRRLFVVPAYRNQRIGLKLIDRALQFCEEVGYKEIIFRTTSRMKGAIQLCQKRGFIPRAHVELGSIKLFKYAFSLRNGLRKV